MAILSRKEYCELLGITPGYLNTYISRGKVNTLPGDKSKIDTEDRLNVFFKRNLKKNKKERVKKEIIKEASAELNPEIEKLYKQVVQQVPKASPEVEDEEDNELYTWELRKKIADTLKAEKQAEKEGLAVEKMMGKLMPTEMVENILKVNIGHIFKSMENELINIGSIYCDILANGDRAKLSEIVARIRQELQRIVENTEETALQEVENVIEEYAETRNRGERK